MVETVLTYLGVKIEEGVFVFAAGDLFGWRRVVFSAMKWWM